MNAPSEWVSLARIRRPQGRKGEVFADILTDFPEKFTERRKLWLLPAGHDTRSAGSSRKTQVEGAPGSAHSGTRDHQNPVREVELVNYWLHKGGIVLHFAGVESISAAESLKGLTVAIPLAERVLLVEDEFYIGDLIGCTLVDVASDAPQDVGIIENVDRAAGPAPLLIVRATEGEVLIPFAKAYLRKIDFTSKRVEMALPEGLVDLNNS